MSIRESAGSSVFNGSASNRGLVIPGGRGRDQHTPHPGRRTSSYVCAVLPGVIVASGQEKSTPSRPFLNSETNREMLICARRGLRRASCWVWMLASLAASDVAGQVRGPGDAIEEGDWLRSVQIAPDQPQSPPRGSRDLLRDAAGEQITSLARWKRRRGAMRKTWEAILNPLPPRSEKAPSFVVLEEEHVDQVLRQRIAYEVEPGLKTEAYLLTPIERSGPVPGVVVFHSTVQHSIRQPAGVEGKPEKFYGLKLAQRGYVALCPRNYLWPTNHGIMAQQEADRFHSRLPHCTGMAKMLHDGLVAVDLLASLPDIDQTRLGAVGHSLGAKEVLYLAAFDERIRATVSSEGGIGTSFSNWDAPWYLGQQVNDKDFLDSVTTTTNCWRSSPPGHSC